MNYRRTPYTLPDIKLILLIVWLVILFIPSAAKTYYFSSSQGSDGYSTEQAQHPSTPWKSINKLNSIIPFLQKGDSILLKRGDVFTGAITIHNSPGNIFLGSYGKGSKPEINGLKKLSDWIKVRQNIWMAKCDERTDLINLLLVNNTPAPLGRYPNPDATNKGYLSISDHVGNTQITSYHLDTTDWTGGEAVVRSKRWILDRVRIKHQETQTLFFGESLSYEPMNNFGFFIQNHINTLDRENEWFYSAKEKNIYLYRSISPQSHQIHIGIYSSLLTIAEQLNIIVEGIVFNGAAKNAIEIQKSQHVEIRNCDFINTGVNAVSAKYSTHLKVINNDINRTLNNAINIEYSDHVVVHNNDISNTALIAGMGLGKDGNYNAMFLSGTNYTITRNRIDSVGYNGIHFWCDSIIIKNNVVADFCINKDDGGGIYTYSNGSKVFYHQYISKNIILNGHGAPAGTPLKDFVASGIYLDDRSDNIQILHNTVLNCNYNGIYVRNSKNIKTIGNTLFNNGTQIRFLHDTAKNTLPITNCETYHNILLSALPEQHTMYLATVNSRITDIGSFNHNYYCRPSRDTDNIIVETWNDRTYSRSALRLSEWKEFYQKDINSTTTPIFFNAFTVNKLLTENLLSNEDQQSASNWSCWSERRTCRMEIEKSKQHSDTPIKVSFELPTYDSHASLYVISKPFPVKKEKKYLLSFNVKSDSSVTLTANLRRDSLPFYPIAAESYFKADIEPKNYHYVFTAYTNEAAARIDFEILETDRTVWLGNFQLYEADLTTANLSDVMLFEYNDRGQSKKIHLREEYIDASGNVYSDTITIEPFSSIVLFKKSTVDDHQFHLAKSKIFTTIKSYRYILGFLTVVAFGAYFVYRRNLVMAISVFLLILSLATWILI